MSEAPEKILISNFHGTGISSTIDKDWQFGTWCTEWEKSSENFEYVRADLVAELSKKLDQIRGVEEKAYSLRDCDVGMTEIRKILNSEEASEDE